MNSIDARKKYLYYLLFGITFLSFNLVQDFIRPNYNGGHRGVIYFLGIAPNFLPAIGLPALFYVIIPELFSPETLIRKNKLRFSVGIAMVGLIGNEFITIYTLGKGVFDWNDVLWTIIGGVVFYWINKRIHLCENL